MQLPNQSDRCIGELSEDGWKRNRCHMLYYEILQLSRGCHHEAFSWCCVTNPISYLAVLTLLLILLVLLLLQSLKGCVRIYWVFCWQDCLQSVFWQFKAGVAFIVGQSSYPLETSSKQQLGLGHVQHCVV